MFFTEICDEEYNSNITPICLIDNSSSTSAKFNERINNDVDYLKLCKKSGHGQARKTVTHH